MLRISGCTMVLASYLLVILLSSAAWATLISKRHSIHLSVNEPDDPRFSLANLAKVYYLQLLGKKTGTNIEYINPFEVEPKCNSNDKFRTIDGTCNNLNKPFMGAAKTPLMRLVPNEYEDGIDSPKSTLFSSDSKLPKARVVSLAVHDITSNISNRHSHLMMNFGQFTDHDLTLSPEAGGEGGEESPKEECCDVSKELWVDRLRECFALLTPDDPIFSTSCVQLVRSAPVPGLPGAPIERFQLNDLTAFIDASQVYGSTNIRAKSLRSFKDGRLLTSEGLNNEERLPLAKDNPSNCFTGREECRFASGDVRNSEQAALTSVHTLLLREHNRIAGRIQTLNPFYSDELIYQTARKIVVAIMQRITYREFLPEVVGPEIMQTYGLTLLESGRFRGYSPSVDASILTEFSTAAFRFGHSLIRQNFATSPSRSLDIREVFDAFKTVEEYGSDALLEGLSSDNSEVRERFITTGIRDNLLGGEMDLPAFNIQRGRDHGITSYNGIRRNLGLTAYGSFDELVGKTHNLEAVNALREVYPTVEDVEMFPGGLSEISLKDALVGETFAHIIGTQFRRIKFGDRFWFETNDRTVRLSDEQLAEVRKASLAGLFCQNVPGASVREFLLVAEISQNPTVDCGDIPTVDFAPWRE